MLDLKKLLASIGATAAQQPIVAEPMPVSADITNRPTVPVVEPVEQPVSMQYGRPNTTPVAVPQTTAMGVNDQLQPEGLSTQAPPPEAPVAPVLSPLQQQEQKYQQDLTATPKHVSPWAQALYFTLQGIGKTLQPDGQPFQGLGEARKQHQLQQDRQTLLPLREQAKVQAQEQAQQADIAKSYAMARKQMADIEHQQRTDALAGKKWTTEVNNGLKFKHYADGHLEPLYDAEGKQMREDTLTPVERTLSDGTKVYQTGPQAATVDAARVAADAQREQGTRQFNVTKALDVAKENAQRKFEADKTNIANELNWHKTNLDKAVDVITANANLFADAGTAQGLATEARTLAETADDLTTRLEAATDDAEKKSLQKQIDAIPAKMAALQAKMGTTLGKIDRTGALTRQLETQKIPKPKKVTWEPLKAESISPVRTSGKIAPSSQVDAFAK